MHILGSHQLPEEPEEFTILGLKALGEGGRRRDEGVEPLPGPPPPTGCLACRPQAWRPEPVHEWPCPENRRGPQLAGRCTGTARSAGPDRPAPPPSPLCPARAFRAQHSVCSAPAGGGGAGGLGGAGPHRTTQRGSQARPVRGSRASQGLQCDSRTSACDFSGPWCEVGRTSCFPRCGSAAGERAPRAGRRVPEPVRAGASPPRVTACHPGNGRPAASSPERRLLLSRARPEARAGRPVLQGVGADWEPRPSRAAQGTVRARQEGPEAETGSAEGRQQD